jgi:hypothetical protein
MCKVLLNLLGKQKSEVLKLLLDLYMLGKDFEWSGSGKSGLLLSSCLMSGWASVQELFFNTNLMGNAWTRILDLMDGN